MKPTFIAMALLFSMAIHGEAFAQSCPHGYMPLGGQQAGWTGCAPMSQGEQAPPDPGPSWASRWGAVAVDSNAGKFGAVDGATSKRRAYKAAISDCERNGGRKCKVLLGYYNQCGALAAGSAGTVSYSASQQSQAIDGAMQRCDNKTDNCQIYYAGCSYPVQVH